MLVDDLIVEVRDGSYIRQGQFVAADLGNFLVVPRANSIGSWSIDLPDSIELDNGSVVPHPLCLLLRTPASGIVVTDPTGVIFSGPMRSAIHSSTTDDPGGTWTLSGVSDATVIAECEAWPEPSNPDGTTQTVANDVRTAAAETLLHQFLSANIGPTASAARKNPILTLGTDLARGPLLTKSPRYQNMLELFQEITAGTDLLFDIVQVGDLLQLRTWEADDLTDDIRMDIANNQLDSLKYQYAAPGVTVVNVLGQDQGVDRQFVQRTSAASLAAAALWGLRIEKTLDQRQTDDVTELEQAGDEDLANEGDTITSLQIVPSDDQQQSFNVGDYVTVVVGTEEVAAQVTEKPIQLTAGSGVFVGATVGDPYAFDWESLIDSQVTDLTKRLSALERTVEVPASLYTQDQLYTRAELDGGQLDTRYYTETEIAAMFADSLKVGMRRAKPASIAFSGGAAVVDSNGDIRVTTSGCTAISLNSLFKPGKSYRFQVYSQFSSTANVAVRSRLAGVDNTTADYVIQMFFNTQAWTGTTAANGYGSVTNSGLLSVNGGTFGFHDVLAEPASSTSYPSTFHTKGISRTGSQGTVFSGGFDSSSSQTRDGITFFGGTFQVGTIIRVWEYE